MSTRNIVICLSICLLPVCGAFGQTDLPGEQVEVIKNFDARLMDARKFAIRPQLPPLDTVGPNYSYQVSVDNPAIYYPAPVLRPLAIRPDKPPESYDGTARLGYGAPNALLAELSYFYDNDEDLHLGFDFRHNSADRKDFPLQQYSDNDFRINGSYLASDALSVTGDIGYSFDQVNFYGIDPTDFTLYLDEGRKYKTFTGEVQLSNSERLAGDYDYHVAFDYYNHQDDLATRETGGIFEFGGKKWINGNTPLSLVIIADLTTLKDTAKRSLNNFFLRPSATFKGSQYRIEAGLNIASHDDEFMFFPQVQGSFKVVGNKVIAFAGADGGLRKNHFYALSDYNPFISERITSIRNTQFRSYYGGVKGRLKVVEYEGKVSYNTLENLALFLHAENDSRKFQPIYDDGSIVRIEGVVRTNPIRGLEVGGSIAKHFYNLDNQQEPWHLPGFEARLFSSYQSFDDKLRIHGDLFIENGVPYIDEFNQIQRLNSLFDISLGADYYFTNNIGVFVQGNNLVSNKRQRWLRYPTYGINGVAGVIVRL